MAAKLCLGCGGSGKLFVPSLCISNMGMLDEWICIRCEKCKGLGYIPIAPKSK